jgi:DNA integrity scanning protein DisA with diadenylate cyclase activity
MFRDKQTDIDTGFGGRHRAPRAASAPRVVHAYWIVSI